MYILFKLNSSKSIKVIIYLFLAILNFLLLKLENKY